ncbi:hypothetical protein CT0861_10623 [Colletotrichum tofieldiae]|uniref:DUF6546 domain-containing protein n=1 Tax=Colletotrichum tofieldiae TaxID=708197 RepID=A0A166NA72_9PEZI|nr:hypothetical protein CT0861_10623 [Colletotrichum tofieldiae]
MAPMNPDKTSLPMELHLLVMEHLKESHYSDSTQRHQFAPYTCVSRSWQAFFERLTFKNLILRIGDVSAFREHTQTPERRGHVNHIWLRLEEKRFDLDEPVTPTEHNVGYFGTSLLHLWNTLAAWEARPSGQGLTLELSIHMLAGLLKYDRHAPEDDLGNYSTYLDTGSLRQYEIATKFAQRSPRWVEDIVSEPSNLAGANRSLYTSDVSMRNVVMPSVEVVTKFLTRRANTRNLRSKTLGKILGSLPRLEEVHIERWRLSRVGDERRWLTGLSPSIKKFNIFHETSDWPQDPTATTAFMMAFEVEPSDSLVRGAVHLETLSLCHIVQAENFFRSVLEGRPVFDVPVRLGVERGPLVIFKNLTHLTLTCDLLAADLNSTLNWGPEWKQGVNRLLLSAAKAVAGQMPKLRRLEIWDIQDGEVCVFCYEVHEDYAELVWKSAVEARIFEDGVVKAWETAAEAHGKAELRIRTGQVVCNDFEYYGFVLPHLESKHMIIHPVSAAQMG